MEPLNSVPAILRRISMVLSILIMLAATIWLLVIWPSVPETVPSHFSADGTPSSFAGKKSLFAPLIIGWMVAALFIVLEFFPQYWNIPSKSNGFPVSIGKFSSKSNNGAQAAPGAIESMRSMMAVDRVMISLLFAVITICSAKGKSLPVWAMIVIIAAMAIGSAFFSIQASRRNM